MGWNLAERPGFIFLHTISFVLHCISCGLIFYLAPPDDITKPLKVETYNYTTVNGKPDILVGEANVFDHANAFYLIGANEALTALSHLIAISQLTIFYKPEKERLTKYYGRSREKEYLRRWIEYGFTAGFLEVGILIGQGEQSFILILMILLGNIAMQMIGFYNDQANLNKDSRQQWSVIPSISAFFIMFSIIIVFIFHSANNINEQLEALNYSYLAIVFSIMYLSFGVHQMLYLLEPNYGVKWDVDKIYIVLGFTAKIVLSWTYIAIARQTWDELGDPWDDKIPWEGGESSIATWDTVKVGLLIGALLVIILAYVWFGRPTVLLNGYSAIETSDKSPIMMGGPVRNSQWKVRSRRGTLNF